MKKTFLAFFIMNAIFFAHAKSFSLQVIQKNTPCDDVLDLSYVIEQAIMDYFFERGMIVSNGAVIVSNKDGKSESEQIRRSFVEAKEGSMDLFVSLRLNYALENSASASAILLSNIKNVEVEVVSIPTSKTLAKQTYAPKKISDENNNRGGVESFAADIAMDIQAQIGKKGGAK